jgi:hypothetical protein
LTGLEAALVGGLFYFRLSTPSWFAGSLAVKLRRRSTYEKLWPCESSSQRRSLRYWRWPPRPKVADREKGASPRPDAQKTEDLAKKKADEQVYKDALKQIPVSKEKPDPWKTMR